jgi:hypothetical protein
MQREQIVFVGTSDQFLGCPSALGELNETEMCRRYADVY